jgi:hypothetical protein
MRQRRNRRYVTTLTVQGCLPCNKTSIYNHWDICNQTYSDCQGNCEAL